MGLGFGSDERGAAEHENTCHVLVFSRSWAEEAPNTQNVPMGRVLCVRIKENNVSYWCEGGGTGNDPRHEKHTFFVLGVSSRAAQYENVPTRAQFRVGLHPNTRNVPIWTCSRVWVQGWGGEEPQHENHAHLGTMSCCGAPEHIEHAQVGRFSCADAGKG